MVLSSNFSVDNVVFLGLSLWFLFPFHFELDWEGEGLGKRVFCI